MRKQADIAADLRRAIRSGRYKPGARLPTVRELTASTGAGLPTVHRALRTLAGQGFISSDGRHGTHVVDHPPHRCRFGLVLPQRPDAAGRYPSLLAQAMAEAAAAISRPERRLVIHHGINQHPELPEHRRLLDECADGLLAGLLVQDPGRIDAWFDLQRCRVPFIAPAAAARGCGTLVLDQWLVLERALAEAAAAGCRRLAFLGDGNAHTLSYLPNMRRRAAALGLDLPIRRIACAPLACPAWAGQAVAALWDADRAPPDALIVLDDNLVAEAVAGLRAVGGTPLLLHLANWPTPATSWRPLVRIGWDQCELLAAVVARLAERGVDNREIRVALRVEGGAGEGGGAAGKP